jgi:hypothetical protein
MAMTLRAHRIIRAALLLLVAGGIGLLSHRMRRSDEQLELTRYVERELPPLLEEEQAIADGIDAMLADKALPAAEARRRLVDDLVPRLVRLRRRAEALAPSTVTVRQLGAGYLAVLDAWTEGARAAVRAIDDPQLTTAAAVASVRERLAEAARADREWRARLVQTCEHHRLARPQLAR